MKISNSFAVVLLVSLAGVTAFFFFKTSIKDETPNPYEYDVTQAKEKSRASDSFTELEPIKLNDKKYACVATGSDSKIYVGGEKILTVFSPERKILQDSPVAFDVEAIHIANNNGIFIGTGNKVIVLGQDLKPAREIGGFPEESIITSIAADDKNIFVADAGMKKVWRFDEKGKPAGEITGIREGEEFGFVIPSPYFPICLDKTQGTIWISDTGNHKVANFAYDGKLISEWGTYSMEPEGFCGCCNPVRFAIAKDGSFVTAEKGIVRIKSYDQSGKFLSIVAGPDEFDTDCRPVDMALDPDGRIIVLDPSRNEIRIFARK